MTETDNDTIAKLILKWFWNHPLTGWVLSTGLAVMMLITGCERTQNRNELRDLRKETHNQAVKIQRLALENAALKSKVTP